MESVCGDSVRVVPYKGFEPCGVSRRKFPLRRYVSHIFPREVLRSRPVQGEHFTDSALRQMTPCKKAAAVVALCDSLISGRYTIIETCAGIGGNAMAFVTSPRVSALHLFEANPHTAHMLRANMSNIKAPQASVTYADACSADRLAKCIAACQDTPVGVFIDPPWGMKLPYVDVMQQGLAPPETVQSWVQTALDTGAVFVIVKVPKDYRPTHTPVPPYEVFTDLTKMDMLVFKNKK